MTLKPGLAAVLARHKVEIFRIVEDAANDKFTIFMGEEPPNNLKADLDMSLGGTWNIVVKALPPELTHPSGKIVLPPAKGNDAVNHPSHYNSGKIEVIEFIEDQKLNYHVGNTIKYLARAGKKDPAKLIEDLDKAAWYLARHIENLRAEKEGRSPVRPNDMVKK